MKADTVFQEECRGRHSWNHVAEHPSMSTEHARTMLISLKIEWRSAPRNWGQLGTAGIQANFFLLGNVLALGNLSSLDGD